MLHVWPASRAFRVQTTSLPHYLVSHQSPLFLPHSYLFFVYIGEYSASSIAVS